MVKFLLNSLRGGHNRQSPHWAKLKGKNFSREKFCGRILHAAVVKYFSKFQLVMIPLCNSRTGLRVHGAVVMRAQGKKSERPGTLNILQNCQEKLCVTE